MDSFAPHLSPGQFRPEAYTALDLPPRAIAANPDSAREVDRDRAPTQPVHGEATIELGFADFLDVINPLQHIPVVSDIYRALTDDQITAPARVAGGVLFGGPLGFISGIFNAVVAEAAGQNLGEVVVAAIFGDEKAGGGEKTEPELAQTAALTAGPATESTVMPVEAKQVVAADRPLSGASQARQPLTGAAALRALGADLRTAGRRPDAAPAPAQPRVMFADRLIEGLNQYKALVTEKNAPSVPPGTAVDKIL